MARLGSIWFAWTDWSCFPVQFGFIYYMYICRYVCIYIYIYIYLFFDIGETPSLFVALRPPPRQQWTDTPPIFLSCTISRRISMTRDEWHSSLGRECRGDATKSKPKLERIQAVLEGPSASRSPSCELCLNPKTFQHLSGYGQSQLWRKRP